ncbi:MAG TPA: DNA internalization-related competence protein ComEC/Rec2 [Thermodesulfobacteriota bacterium]|nr:DNA internalization-related competence protein ComEC/Rec2 [Thermodesulfobacteriota bacterium]
MHPLVPLLAAFVTGAVFSGLYDMGRGTLLVLVSCSLLPIIVSRIRKRPFSRIHAAAPFFFIGALFVIPYLRPEFPAGHIVNFVRHEGRRELPGGTFLPATLEGRVVNDPEFTGQRTRLAIEAERILSGGVWKHTSGTVQLAVNGRAGLEAGDRIRFTASLKEPYNYGNPGEFDYVRYLKLKSVFVTGFVKDAGLIERVEAAEGGTLERHRKRIRDLIDSSNARNKEFLKALLIADKGGIAPSEKEAFNRTGVAHILAISGLHVGVVALFAYSAALFLLKRSERLMLAVNIRKAALAFSFLPVFLYGMTAGFPVSTVRAVIMAGAFTVTFFLDRGRDFLNTLALSALIILLITPYSVWDLSFQLSFAAVFGIIYMTPGLDRLFPAEKKDGGPFEKKGRLVRLRSAVSGRLKDAFLVTLSAGAATAPILAYNFHRVSFVGLAANLVAVPLTGAVVPLLLVSSLASAVSTGLASVFLTLADLVFSLILMTVKAFASLPYSSVWVTTPTPFEIVLYYALLFFAVNLNRDRRLKYAALVVAALIAADQGYYGWFNKSHDLRVTFISVGQGDSGLVETPEGATMLIDGGGVWGGFDIGEKVVAPFLWSKKIKRIDCLVLSHAQRDHMDGLRFIAENFSVGEFWWNGVGSLGGLGKTLEERGVPVKIVNASSGRRALGGAVVETLHPSGGEGFDTNNMGLVLRVGYGNTRILFTGDIGKEAEEELSKKDIRAEVLKSPHHGSRYSSSEGFLKAVRPSVVVVSAGRFNAFHFPHEDTLERYKTAGALVLRTDTDGAVTVRTDGESLAEEVYLTGGPR